MNKTKTTYREFIKSLAEFDNSIFLVRNNLGELLFIKENVEIELIPGKYSDQIKKLISPKATLSLEEMIYQKSLIGIKENSNDIVINGILNNRLTSKKNPIEISIQFKQIYNEQYLFFLIIDRSKKFLQAAEILNQERVITSIYLTFQKIMSRQDYIPVIDDGFKQVSDYLKISKVNIYLKDEQNEVYNRLYTFNNPKYSNENKKNMESISLKEFEAVERKMHPEKPVLFNSGCPFTIDKDKSNFDNQIICYFLPLQDNFELKGFIKIDELQDNNLNFTNRLDKYEIYCVIINSLYSLLNRTIDLANNNRNFRHIYNSINDVFFLFDFRKNKYIFMSPSCEKVFGKNQFEFYSEGAEIYDLIFESDKGLFREKTKELSFSDFISFEFRILKNDSTFNYILAKVYPVKNKKNELVEISGICIDITEKKLQEKLIKESHEIINAKNIELSQKNDQINKLLKTRETDIYLKSVNLSNTKNLIQRTKNEIEELALKESINSKDLIRITKYLDQVMSDKIKLWQEIQLEFERIRPNFFSKILEKHNGITNNDLKHCYYITTGLSAQEAANLLNISVRSVETARYRIKKKFNLNTKESLQNYLNQF